jgi:hypothetical protein
MGSSGGSLLKVFNFEQGLFKTIQWGKPMSWSETREKAARTKEVLTSGEG